MKRTILFFMFVLASQHVWADYITSDIANACVKKAAFRTVFARKQITCANGYFLPANTETCQSCPLGHSCAGGTYAFNERLAQGAKYSSPITNDMNKICYARSAFRAVFAPRNIVCSAGYYLLANADICTQCPAGSACVGGTYSFNETTDQGIVACDNGYHSSAGASSCTPNTITINWSGADDADILANNAGQCTYGGDIRTPVKAQHIPGQTFVGWTFDVQ